MTRGVSKRMFIKIFNTMVVLELLLSLYFMYFGKISTRSVSHFRKQQNHAEREGSVLKLILIKKKKFSGVKENL